MFGLVARMLLGRAQQGDWVMSGPGCPCFKTHRWRPLPKPRKLSSIHPGAKHGHGAPRATAYSHPRR